MMKTSIHWFRLDLRLADNPALIAARQSARAIVPVFIWAPEEESPWQPGAASRWWLRHSLAALEGELQKVGSRLIIRRGPTLATLRAVVKETGATAVFWNRRYEPAVIARDAQVQQALSADGVQVETFNSALLFEPAEIQTGSGGPYRVFTPFWRACLKRGVEPSPTGSWPPTSPKHWPVTVRLGDLGLLPKLDWARGFDWQPGAAGAVQELRRFQRAGMAGYKTGRDLPARAGTSRLSPHLHFGEIAPQQVWAAVPSEEFRRQLVWREFAHHLLVHFPQTAEQPLRPEFSNFPWRTNRKELKAWQRGATGFSLVDAGLRELWATGWMHNRVRMVAASFLVKDLLIPWQAGARWFWDTLVDADLANNTLGWQWVAGCGADAAPFFRIFNPATQADKFDPAGEYIRRWMPEPVPPIVDHAAARVRALAALQPVKK